MKPVSVNETCFSDGSDRFDCEAENRFFAAHITCMDPCHVNERAQGTPLLAGCLKPSSMGSGWFAKDHG